MIQQLASARWEAKASGIVALTQDWPGDSLPPLTLNPPAKMIALERADGRAWSLRSGHWFETGRIHFFFWKSLCPEITDGSIQVGGLSMIGAGW